MSGFETQRLRRLLRLLRESPMQALEACKADFDGEGGSENEKKYQALGFIVEYTTELTRSPTAVQELRMHGFWPADRYRPKVNNVPLMATRFFLDANEGKGPRYQQALAWSKVVDYCIGKRMEAEEVFDFLCENTIYGAIGLAAMEDEAEAEEEELPSNGQGTSPPTSIPADKGSLGAPTDAAPNVDEADEKKNERGMETGPDATNDPSANREQKPRRKTISLENDFVIDPGVSWKQLLDMKKDECVDLTLRCVRDKGFKRYRVERVEPMRRVQHEDV